MEISEELVFKNREKEKPMWRQLHRLGSNSVCLTADNEGNEVCLYFDLHCLKELALLINEFLFRGVDIDMVKRGSGDYGEKGPKVKIAHSLICLEDDNIAVCVEDSKDLEYDTFVFSIVGKEKDHVEFTLKVEQAKQISKVLKQFVLSYELNSRAHKGVKSIPATNPA